MKKYIVKLEGQGDTYIHLVNKDRWDWIHNKDQPPPDVIVDAIFKEEKPYSDPGLTREDIIKDVQGYKNSWDNDRALNLSWDPDTVTLSSLTEFVKYITDNKVKIESEYHGYIY